MRSRGQREALLRGEPVERIRQAPVRDLAEEREGRQVGHEPEGERGHGAAEGAENLEPTARVERDPTRPLGKREDGDPHGMQAFPQVAVPFRVGSVELLPLRLDPPLAKGLERLPQDLGVIA